MRRAQTKYEGNGQTGVFTTRYDVLLNRAGLLSLALTTEYSGAYPWSATQHATFEVASGRLLALPDLLADTLALRQRWHQRINRRLAAHLRAVAQPQQYRSNSAALATVREYTYWSDSAHQIPIRSRPPLREFALTPQGLVLYTEFWFPHAALALSPNDEYPFLYAQVLPWVGSRSLLHRLPHWQ